MLSFATMPTTTKLNWEIMPSKRIQKVLFKVRKSFATSMGRSLFIPFKDKNLIGNILGYLIELYKGTLYPLFEKSKKFKEATVAHVL